MAHDSQDFHAIHPNGTLFCFGRPELAIFVQRWDSGGGEAGTALRKGNASGVGAGKVLPGRDC